MQGLELSRHCPDAQGAPHRQARFIALATIEMLLPYRPWVHTITVDNGLEFAAHAYAAKFLKAQFYFCKPYHSWQREQIEHLNGLVRRTFQKSSPSTT